MVNGEWLIGLRGSRWPEAIHINRMGRSRSPFPVRGFMAYGQWFANGALWFSVYLCALCVPFSCTEDTEVAQRGTEEWAPRSAFPVRGFMSYGQRVRMGECCFLLLWMSYGQRFANGALWFSVYLCALCVPFSCTEDTAVAQRGTEEYPPRSAFPVALALHFEKTKKAVPL
jgi:hypothetical protein